MRLFLRDLGSAEDGNVLVTVALALPLLVGSAGLAVDTIQWTWSKRNLQAAADAAATAGVYAAIQGDSVEDAVAQALARSGDTGAGTNVQVVRFPEGHESDSLAVEVRLAAPAALSFTGMFLSSKPSIGSSAIATVVETGEFCALALGDDPDSGLRVEPSSRVTSECGLSANAPGKGSVTVVGGSVLDAPKVVAYGGIKGVSADGEASIARSRGLKQPDPLKDSKAPLVPNTGCPPITINPDAPGTVSLKPNCYGSLTLNGEVALEAGQFILNRGNFIVGPSGKVTCRGCTIVLTSQDAGVDPASIGKVRIDPKATVKMSAPQDGPLSGVLFYQDRRAARELAGQESLFGGSSFSQLEGMIYMPAQAIRVDARLAPDLRCSRWVGRRLILDGRVVIAKDCSGKGGMTFAGTEVRLVG